MKNGGFLDLKGINSLQVWTSEIGRHIFLFWILGWKDTPLIWATLSTESLYEDIEEEVFVLLLPVFSLLTHPFLY